MSRLRLPVGPLLPALVAGALFLVVFWHALATLLADWWSDPDAGHGLLLAPLALWLAWRAGRVPDARPARIGGLLLLTAALALRYASGLAIELFTMRMSLLMGVAALTVYALGWRQLRHSWLPAALIVLSVPLPDVVVGSLAQPLQLQASRLAAGMLEARYVPVALAGNVIHLPGQTLFVTEACSGLRSLTALLSLGVLIGGLWLGSPLSRIALVVAAVPVAMALNGFRVFLTGFLAYFASPELGTGFMHVTEGWAIFVAAFLILGGAAWLLARLEGGLRRAPA